MSRACRPVPPRSAPPEADRPVDGDLDHQPAPRDHPGRRRRRLQPPDARRRGGHAGRPARPSRRAGGAGGRALPRPHRQDGGRRRADRVRQRHRGGALGSRAAARHGRAQRGHARRAPPGLPHRAPSRRHHRLRRGRVRRHGQRGVAAGRPGRARIDRAVGQRLRAGARQARLAVSRPGRARAEEHRPADPGLFAGCSGPVAGWRQAAPDKDSRAPSGGRGCGHRGGAGDRRRPCLLRRSRGLGRYRGDHASRPGNGKRPFGRRPDVHQPERRCRPGLFLRRPHRGHHPGARPLQGADGDLLQRRPAVPEQGAAAAPRSAGR